MSLRSWTAWGAMVCATLLVSVCGCGRSVLTDDALIDGGGGGGSEAGGGGDGPGPGPCVPDCRQICQLQQSCNLIRAGDLSVCQARCQGHPDDPGILCLKDLACVLPVDCAAARRCLYPDPQLPDLYVKGASWSGAGQITYSISVCNKGLTPSEGTSLAIYFSRTTAPQPTSKPDAEIKVQPLAPGACSSLSTTQALPPGEHLSWFYVDRPNLVFEQVETNNVYGPMKVKVGVGPGPDLTVTQLSAYPTPTGSVTYVVEVCNLGSSTAGASVVDLFYDLSYKPDPWSTPDQSLSVGSLGAGACNAFKVPAYLNPGTHTSWAYVDRKNAVKETNDANNIYGPVKVTVGGGGPPDLVVTSLTANPSSTGQSSTYYTAKVCNYGKGASTQTTIELYYDRKIPPGPNDKGDLQKSVPALKPGSCVNVTLWANLKPGTYSSWVYVDRPNIVKESSEANNVGGPVKVTVTGGGNKCQIICATAISPCNILPSGMESWCLSFCASQPQSTVQCAYNASLKKDCQALMSCVFGP